MPYYFLLTEVVGPMIVWLDPNNVRYRNKTIFLDRDGVINYNRTDYVKTPEEFIIYEDAIPALEYLYKSGFQLIIISNQSGLGRGIISWESFWDIHFKLIFTLNVHNCVLVAAFYCPHRPEDECSCRKPKADMILEASAMFDLPVNKCFFVGDQDTDMEAARNAGCRGIKIIRNGGLDVVSDLFKAAHIIVSTYGKENCEGEENYGPT